MKGFVTVDTPEDFEKWLGEQAAAAVENAPPAAARRLRPRSPSPAAAPAGTHTQASAEREGRTILEHGRRPRTPSRGSAWASPPHAGVHAAPTSFWRKYIFSLDHKVIGKQYLLYAPRHAGRRRAARDARPLAARLAGPAAPVHGQARARGNAGRRDARRSSTTRSSRCTRRS